MKAIGIFDAKTRLSQLIEMVIRGEEFTITKHGEAVARVAPITDNTTLRIRKMAKDMNIKMTLEDIQEYKQEERK
jgi:prevent-host-death family protein